MRIFYIILFFLGSIQVNAQDISFVSPSPNIYINPAYAGYQAHEECRWHVEATHRQQWIVTSPKAFHAHLIALDKNFNLRPNSPTNFNLGLFVLNSEEGESNYMTNKIALMTGFSSSFLDLGFSMAFQVDHTRIEFDDNLIFSNQIDPVLGPVIAVNNILPVLPYRSTDVSAGFNINNFGSNNTPSTKSPRWLKAITGCEYYNFDLGVAVHHFQSLSTYSFYQDNVNHPMKLTFNSMLLLKNNPSSHFSFRGASVVFRKEIQALQSYNATSVKNIILTNFDFGNSTGLIKSKDFIFNITAGVSFQDFLGLDDIGDTYSAVFGIGLPSLPVSTYILTELPVSSGYGGLTFELKIKYQLPCGNSCRGCNTKGKTECPAWYYY